MNVVKEGDVVILKAGTLVQIGHDKCGNLAEEKKCVVVATRKSKPGTEDDHFEESYVVDLQPLEKDTDLYVAKSPVYTVAQYGDFHEKYTVGEMPVVGKMQKTYVKVDDVV